MGKVSEGLCYRAFDQGQQGWYPSSCVLNLEV